LLRGPGFAFEIIVQRLHLPAAHFHVEDEIKRTAGTLVMPDGAWRSTCGGLGRAEQLSSPRLIQGRSVQLWVQARAVPSYRPTPTPAGLSSVRQVMAPLQSARQLRSWRNDLPALFWQPRFSVQVGSARVGVVAGEAPGRYMQQQEKLLAAAGSGYSQPG
jgi:hypothetical protein